MTLKKIECPYCFCIRHPVRRKVDGYTVYVCPECLEPIEKAVTKAYNKPPKDKMIRRAVNK